MLVTFGTFRGKQDFLNLQNRCYVFAFFGHEAGLEKAWELRVPVASRSLRACLPSPEERQARLPKSPFRWVIFLWLSVGTKAVGSNKMRNLL